MYANNDHPWIELDSSALLYNLQCVRGEAGKALVFAVVKANAYGHGLTEVADVLQSSDVDGFIVADIAEAIMLRDSGIQGRIIVIGPVFSKPDLTEAIDHCLELSATSLDHLIWLSRFGRRALSIHLIVDVGMTRLGIPVDKITKLGGLIGSRNAPLIAGVMAHTPSSFIGSSDKSVGGFRAESGAGIGFFKASQGN